MSPAGEVDAGQLQRIPGSFRDPSGFLFERDGTLLRTVSRGFADSYDRLLDSGLYERLVAENLLVPHEEVDPRLADDLAPDGVHRVLRPERIPFVSYPYEWCPAQLRAAALLTLRLQAVALEHDMTLRDASAYNVQFRGTDPVFIDTLSFGPYTEGDPWVGHAQFCRHFLAPLALQTTVDVRLADLLRANVDGLPLDLAAGLLPLRTRLSPGLLTHIHMQARAQRRSEATPGEEARTARFSRRAMEGLVDQLRRVCRKLTWDDADTTWSGYYQEAGHYSEDAMRHKEDTVASFLDRIAPATVWDLGANTGRFSRLAAAGGAQVTAFDVDRGAVEGAYRSLDEDPPESGTVLPLVLDLTNPSPGIGWANEERHAIAERAPADAVLALALVHHLAIGNNVPLPRIVEMLAGLGDHVVVEFVPKSDPKVEVLLATREDVFDDYTVAGFEAAAATHARVVERVEVEDSARILHPPESR